MIVEYKTTVAANNVDGYNIAHLDGFVLQEFPNWGFTLCQVQNC